MAADESCDDMASRLEHILEFEVRVVAYCFSGTGAGKCMNIAGDRSTSIRDLKHEVAKILGREDFHLLIAGSGNVDESDLVLRHLEHGTNGKNFVVMPKPFTFQPLRDAAPQGLGPLGEQRHRALLAPRDQSSAQPVAATAHEISFGTAAQADGTTDGTTELAELPRGEGFVYQPSADSAVYSYSQHTQPDASQSHPLALVHVRVHQATTGELLLETPLPRAACVRLARRHARGQLRAYDESRVVLISGQTMLEDNYLPELGTTKLDMVAVYSVQYHIGSQIRVGPGESLPWRPGEIPSATRWVPDSSHPWQTGGTYRLVPEDEHTDSSDSDARFPEEDLANGCHR